MEEFDLIIVPRDAASTVISSDELALIQAVSDVSLAMEEVDAGDAKALYARCFLILNDIHKGRF